MLQIYYSIFAFLAGAVIGSFLDVMVSRTVSGKSFLMSRSECDSCRKKLQILDLVPLLSYLLLHGSCRYCKAKIPRRLFYMELSTGLIFVITYFATGAHLLQLILLLLIISLLYAIFVADLRFGIIPDQFLIALGTVSLVFVASKVFILHEGFQLFLPHFLTGMVAFGFFMGIFLLTRGKGMGFGDVKFSFFVGFLLSFPLTIASFYIAFLTGAFISLILIIGGKKRLKGGTIPFGPFMALGTVIALLFETQMLRVLQMFFGI